MFKILATKTDALITIFLIVAASLVNQWFGENLLGVAITGIVIILMLIVYDVLRFYIFGKAVIAPLKWLYVSRNKIPLMPVIDIEEKNISSNSTIVVLSPDLKEDASSKHVIDIVNANLSRGVRYILITSNSAKARINLSSVVFHHRDKNNISINAVDEGVIKTVMFDNLMIFMDHVDQTQRGFIQIPDGSRLWWAEMAPEHVSECIENINNILQGETLQHVHGFMPERLLH